MFLYWLLAAMASVPALADTVTLSCRVDGGPEFQTFRIDYATHVIEYLASRGSVVITANADVTENTIQWSANKASSYVTTDDNVRHPFTIHWEGYLNRSSGPGYYTGYYIQNVVNVSPPTLKNVTCRPAMKPF